jgi:hypothetical protein
MCSGKTVPPLFIGGTFWGWSLSLGLRIRVCPFGRCFAEPVSYTARYGVFSVIVVLLEVERFAILERLIDVGGGPEGI